MKISAKTDYACRALLELAHHWPKTMPLGVQTISQRRAIPLKFLTQILLNLKHLGMVKSQRGKEGGYTLAKSPKYILLIDVVSYFMEVGKSPRKSTSALEEIWKDIDGAILNQMKGITFEGILKKEQGLSKTPMYTI